MTRIPFLSLTQRQRLRHCAGAVLRIFLPLSLLVVGNLLTLARAEPTPSEYRIDSTLRMLRTLHTVDGLPSRLQSRVKAKPSVSIRFSPRVGITRLGLDRLERELGIEFTRLDGRIVSVGNIYGARVAWETLERLANWPGVERIDSTWKPAVASPLDVSAGEIGANLVWSQLDAAGWPVTGRGIVIASFDTGIDVFHPDFWRADGGTYSWIDANSNGVLDAGIDAVDLNNNLSAEESERLDLMESASPNGDVPGTNDNTFRADSDWLYNDANGNGLRDWGPASGFVESSPTYGERLFLLDDTNRNRIIDLGEKLLALGTSKVQKTLDAIGSEHTWGIDLIANRPDDDGHGTQACGILCGGVVGLRRYVGVAPDSRLLVADFRRDNLYTLYVPWAEANGADIMLYEYGSWIQEFLDGSSNLEQMLDAETAKGIVQIVPAGNLAEGDKHAHLILGTVSTHDLHLAVPSQESVEETWLSLLWPAAESAASVQLATPAGTWITLPGDESLVTVDGYNVWSYRERSVRGTTRFDVFIYRTGSLLAPGTWTVRLRNNTPSLLNVNAYVADPAHDWSGGVIFTDHIDNMYTVTAPATADTAVAVASYSTRGREVGVAGMLSPFSGQGPRLDGEPLPDIAAPGHYDIVSASSKDVAGASLAQYNWFGGTSAAAPHVAAAVALILQSKPGLPPAAVRQALRDGAVQDAFTGVVPNYSWGWGKLSVARALSAVPTPTPTPRARVFLPVIVKEI